MSNFEQTAAFRTLLKIAARSVSFQGALGVSYVPQEGENAGRTVTLVHPSEPEPSELSKTIEYCEDLLHHQTQPLGITKPDNVDFRPISGAFDSVVLVLWWTKLGRVEIDGETLDFISNSILSQLADSKRSFFHEVFTKELANFDRDALYISISDTIAHGLYCDDVVVWRRSRNRLLCKNRVGLDCTIRGSLAGQAVVNGQQTVDDFDRVPDELIQHRQYLKENDLNSGFIFPIRNFANSAFEVDGVVGVFYHRRKGTTSIDKYLCEYAIRYYELVWNQKQTIDDLTSKAVELDQIKPFYLTAISALADFHDLTSIQLSLSSSISSSLSLAHNRPDIESHLKLAAKRISELKRLLDANNDALTVAPDFLQVVSTSATDRRTVTDLSELVNDEVAKMSGEVRALRGRIRPHVNLNPSKLSVVKKDYVKVLTNLLTNAQRSIGRRTQGGGIIDVTLKYNDPGDKVLIVVEDNGVGIQKADLERIWEVHWTTHDRDGGRGVGLAIVKAIAMKYETMPKCESNWGSGARFEVELGYGQ